MFEEYLQDTAWFLEQARLASRDGREDDSRRFYRASAMLGVASLETFVNFIGATFDQALEPRLADHELALLLDKRFTQTDGRFAIQDRPAYTRLEDKLRFLILRFAVPIDLGSSAAWEKFLRLKRLRDALVHSREQEDTRDIAEYEATCSAGLSGSLSLMNDMSLGIFKRPLRAKLTDLAT